MLCILLNELEILKYRKNELYKSKAVGAVFYMKYAKECLLFYLNYITKKNEVIFNNILIGYISIFVCIIIFQIYIYLHALCIEIYYIYIIYM